MALRALPGRLLSGAVTGADAAAAAAGDPRLRRQWHRPAGTAPAGPPVSQADGKQVAADPAGAAAAARAHVEASAGAIVVHFDVDAVDSADLPLANYPHHGKGLRFDAAMALLRELCASPAFAALVLTEVNPTHDPSGALLGGYIDGVTAALAEPVRNR
jgi:arginase